MLHVPARSGGRSGGLSIPTTFPVPPVHKNFTDGVEVTIWVMYMRAVNRPVHQLAANRPNPAIIKTLLDKGYEVIEFKKLDYDYVALRAAALHAEYTGQPSHGYSLRGLAFGTEEVRNPSVHFTGKDHDILKGQTGKGRQVRLYVGTLPGAVSQLLILP